jgi:voltage-gated potassium channel Kch
MIVICGKVKIVTSLFRQSASRGSVSSVVVLEADTFNWKQLKSFEAIFSLRKTPSLVQKDAPSQKNARIATWFTKPPVFVAIMMIALLKRPVHS